MVNPFFPNLFWGLGIGLYLFLGGLAGGAYATGAVADVLSTRNESARSGYLSTARWGMVIAIAAIAVGGLILLFHLGEPLHVFMIWLFTNFESWMTIGVWIIFLFTLLAVVQALWLGFGRNDGFGLSIGPVDAIARLTRPSENVRRAITSVGALVAVTLIVYTALLLSAVSKVVPLWNPTLLPPLFLASGLSMGIAATVGVTAVRQGVVGTGVQKFSIADDVVILGEIVVLAALLWTMANGGPTAAATYEYITTEGSLILWGGVVAVGLVLPLVISAGLLVAERRYDVHGNERLQRLAMAGYTAKFSFVVVGGLMLRLVIIYGALNAPIIGVSPL
jgi:formate-dependent nitrite reductase membrane component NrfD